MTSFDKQISRFRTILSLPVVSLCITSHIVHAGRGNYFKRSSAVTFELFPYGSSWKTFAETISDRESLRFKLFSVN